MVQRSPRGMKLCRSGASPRVGATGMRWLAARVQTLQNILRCFMVNRIVRYWQPDAFFNQPFETWHLN